MPPTVRIRLTEETEDVQAMNCLMFPGAPLGSLLDSSTWWLAEYNAEGVWTPCGYAGAELSNEGQYCFLSRAGVLRIARGQGLQKRFVYAREAWARRHGATHCWTYTWSGNIPSMRSLVACGYVPYLATPWHGEGVRWTYFKKKL